MRDRTARDKRETAPRSTRRACLVPSRVRRRTLLSALLFVATLSAFALGIAWLMGREGAMTTLQGGIARITSGILNLLGNRTTVVGTTVQSARFSISVVTACTGLFLIAGFAAAVLAYPARLRAKLLGIALGIAAIFGLNIVRLVSLYYIGIYLPTYLDLAHLLVWQSLLIASTLFLWLLWAGKVTGARRA